MKTELSPTELEQHFETFRSDFSRIKDEVQKAVVGYDELITDTLIAVYASGHVLLEGVPGLGKTFLVKVLARIIDSTFGRIQCTPDLMPADVLGTHIVGGNHDGRRVLSFEKGPVFCHMLLVDEINRATPKTQSALLEVMQEHRVTAGGETFELPSPFFVLATQNPLEMEGTYPLPEAQLDRFLFKVHVPYPGVEDLIEISNRTTGAFEPELSAVTAGSHILRGQETLRRVAIAEPITRYAATLVRNTHPEVAEADSAIKRLVSYGASPRGLQALVFGARALCLLDGRTSVSVEDIRRVAKPALRHRIILNFEGEAESVSVDTLIESLLETTPTPEAVR